MALDVKAAKRDLLALTGDDVPEDFVAQRDFFDMALNGLGGPKHAACLAIIPTMVSGSRSVGGQPSPTPSDDDILVVLRKHGYDG